MLQICPHIKNLEVIKIVRKMYVKKVAKNILSRAIRIFNKINPEHLTKNPLIGFQISFPNSKMGDRAAVEYRVNSIYAEHEFSHAG